MRLLEQFSSRFGDDPRDRSFESQVYRASGLNLLIAPIISSSCGTRYLQAAFVELQRAGFPTIITHLAPFRWENIGLTGDYVWTDAEQPSEVVLRPAQATGINWRGLSDQVCSPDNLTLSCLHPSSATASFNIAVSRYRFDQMMAKVSLRASLTISFHSVSAYGYSVRRTQVL